MLEKERQKREELEAKLREMEQSMVVGGLPAFVPGKKRKGEEPQEKKQYLEMLDKFKQQEEMQNKLLEEKQKKEDEAYEAEQKYANLQEEAEALRKTADKLRKKYMSLQREVHDFDRDQEYYKGELLDNIRLLEREVKINNAIMAFLLSPNEMEQVRGNSTWSDERNEFVIPRFQIKVKKQKLPNLPAFGCITFNFVN